MKCSRIALAALGATVDCGAKYGVRLTIHKHELAEKEQYPS